MEKTRSQNDNKVAKSENNIFENIVFDVAKIKNKPTAGTRASSQYEPALAREQSTVKAIETALEQLKQNGVKTCTNSDIVDLLKQIPYFEEKLKQESIPTDTVLYGYGYTRYGQEQKRFEHDKLRIEDLPIRRIQKKPRSPFIFVLNE